MRKNKVAKNVKEFLLDLIFMTAGSVIYAVGLNGFTAPNNIAPGGVSGIAIVLNYLFGTPVGTVILLINVPIIIWAIIEIGYKLVTKTMLAVVLNAACIDIVALFMPVYHGDPLIITLIGGVCEGVGLSLVFMRGATTGGTAMIARLLNHRLRHLSMGKLMLAVDGCVVLFSAISLTATATFPMDSCIEEKLPVNDCSAFRRSVDAVLMLPIRETICFCAALSASAVSPSSFFSLTFTVVVRSPSESLDASPWISTSGLQSFAA